jgi:hypothetical protein
MARVVIDEDAFETLRARVDSTFYISRRLPDMVFQRVARPTLFCEYEAVLGAGFWPALANLASLHGDDTVDVLTLDPDPVTYYRQEYGYYASFSLRTRASPGEYWDAIADVPSGDQAGAIVYTANVVAVTGPSASWGCWGERGLGIAVFQSHLKHEMDVWSERFGPFLTVEGAVESYVAPNFGPAGVPPELSAALLEKY